MRATAREVVSGLLLLYCWCCFYVAAIILNLLLSTRTLFTQLRAALWRARACSSQVPHMAVVLACTMRAYAKM